MPVPNLTDSQYRQAAFSWLADQVRIHGDVLPRDLLTAGFEIHGQRISFLGPQGIWKPKVFTEFPLSIATIIEGPYDDSFSDDGFLLYRYRGTDLNHRDNVGLREAMKHQVPLIYFHSIVKGKYLSVWPVYIVLDIPSQHSFKVAVDDVHLLKFGEQAHQDSMMVSDSVTETVRRLYITSTIRVRLHQRSFRERVIQAYKEQCALCRLRHLELLDAAHIIPDKDPKGEPVVSNGLSLCKLHHAAFDSNLVSVRPDYTIEVRKDILRERDGPMLVHGLQGLHNVAIILPADKKHRPDRELLEIRHKEFKEAG